MSMHGPLRAGGVGLVIEALAALKTPAEAQARALTRVAEVLEKNAAQLGRCAAGSSAGAIEAAIAEMRAEAATFRGAAEQVQAAAGREKPEAEKSAAALAAVDGGKDRAT